MLSQKSVFTVELKVAWISVISIISRSSNSNYTIWNILDYIPLYQKLDCNMAVALYYPPLLLYAFLQTLITYEMLKSHDCEAS